MFDNMDDPRKLMLLMMGAGLLGGAPGQRGKGNVGADLGYGLQQGLLGYQGAQSMQMRKAEEEQQRQMRDMQMQQMKAQFEREQKLASLPGQFTRPGVQPLTPNDDEGNPMPSSPPSFDMPGYANALMGIDPAQGFQMQQALKPKPNFQKLGEGEALYDMADPSRPVATGAPKLPTGMRMGPNGPEPIPEYVSMQERIRKAGKTDVTTNVMPPREIFKDSMALKKDFDAQPEVKGFKEVQSAWDQISTALKDPSAANDLAAATKFMKLLDPGSVVRESELAMAMQASGALDRFMNLGNRITKGHKLTPEQRKEFHSAGEALYTASRDRFGQTVQQYDGIAKQYGLDPQFLPKEQKAAPKDSIKMGGKDYDVKTAPDGKRYVKLGQKWYEVQQ
jgi:hypothetical protein